MIIWKSVCIVLCCVQHIEIYTEQRTLANNINFLLSIEKELLPNHFNYFEKFMVDVLHRVIRGNDGFGVSKVVTFRLQTKNMENCQKIECVELQELADEDDSQTQKYR